MTIEGLNTADLSKVRKLMLYLEEQHIRAVSDTRDAPRNENTFCMEDLVMGVGHCGTVACAAGWSYLAGIVPSLYGCMAELTHRSDHKSPFWANGPEWLFGGGWSDIAPRPIDVVRRIDHLVANGPVGENQIAEWEKIKHNSVDPCPLALATHWNIPQAFKDKYFPEQG